MKVTTEWIFHSSLAVTLPDMECPNTGHDGERIMCGGDVH
jgi:hypothetical protein